MTGTSRIRKPPSYYVEWGYVKGRGFTLNFLALGSMLAFYRVGNSVGLMTFPHSSWLIFATQLAFVALAYYAVDWVLKIVLTDASTVVRQSADLYDINGNKINVIDRNVRYIWQVGISALLITTSISIVSNWFVSHDLSGQSHLLLYQEQLLQKMAIDTTLKKQALQLLSEAGDKEATILAQAMNERKHLIKKAIDNTESASYKRDYYVHQHNPKAWFWTCQQCPIRYQEYRDNIKEAIEKGDALVAQASGYTETITASLSPTLSTQITQDSALIALKETTEILEQERQDKESYLNLILLVMTLAGAIISLLLTYLLRKHREVNGQLINDNPTRFLMITSDILNRIRKVFSDILYTVTFHLHEKAIRKGWIVTYTVEDGNITEELHTTVHQQKRCLKCNARLINKRSDAKFCNDECRTSYHAERKRRVT